jgi:hypothetical protein
MNNDLNKEVKWSENVVLVDADYVDSVAFNLIVNFERMIGRRIPQADIAKWLDCIALDGGIREGENEIQVTVYNTMANALTEEKAPSGLYGPVVLEEKNG